jgi:hypothetical protein
MNPRIVIGGLGAESNSFSLESPISSVKDVEQGRELISKNIGKRTVIAGFLDALGDTCVDIIPTLKAFWGGLQA